MLQLFQTLKGWALGFKVYAIIAAVSFATGFALGWHTESVRFAKFKGAVEAAGKAQEKAAEEKRLRDERLRKEIEDARKRRENLRSQRFTALYARYSELLNTGSGEVRASTASAPEPVRALCYDEREFRVAVGTFAQGVLGLAQAGSEALDDSKWWGEWARGVNACH